MHVCSNLNAGADLGAGVFRRSTPPPPFGRPSEKEKK